MRLDNCEQRQTADRPKYGATEMGRPSEREQCREVNKKKTKTKKKTKQKKINKPKIATLYDLFIIIYSPFWGSQFPLVSP